MPIRQRPAPAVHGQTRTDSETTRVSADARTDERTSRSVGRSATIQASVVSSLVAALQHRCHCSKGGGRH